MVTPVLLLVLAMGFDRAENLVAINSHAHHDEHSHSHGHWHGDEYHVHHHHHDKAPAESPAEHEQQSHDHGWCDDSQQNSQEIGTAFLVARRVQIPPAKLLNYPLFTHIGAVIADDVQPSIPPPRSRAGSTFCRDPVDRLRTVILQV